MLNDEQIIPSHSYILNFTINTPAAATTSADFVVSSKQMQQRNAKKMLLKIENSFVRILHSSSFKKFAVSMSLKQHTNNALLIPFAKVISLRFQR